MRIAVLGAGPAAAAAALTLARGGAEVTVHLPAVRAEKPCGGALPASLLAGLGIDLEPLAAVEVAGATLENATGGRLRVPLDGLRVYRRRDLDPALVAAAAAAGARLLAGRVRWLELDGGVTLAAAGAPARRYDWLIAADGALSPSRRRLGLEPAAASVGLGASLEGPAEREMVLAFPDVGDAYLWIFPRPGGLSVGIAYGPDRLSDGAAGACLDAFLERHLGPGPAAAGRGRYRYPIPVWDRGTLPALRRAVARRVLLVGDAAGLADPLTREGIRSAVRSGRWAGEALLAGRAGDYPERLADGLAAEMARAERACALFYDERIAQWMVPVSRALPGVQRVLGDLLSCRQPYRGLRRRLLRGALSLRRGTPRAPAPGAAG